jgi:CRISPR system Cascade subunit CasE
MVHLDLDARGLATLGRMLHLPLRTVTTQYLVHCALGELFQDHAPKPFSVEDASGRSVRVLGYTAADQSTLQEAARLSASPTVYDLCDWDTCATKPMPSAFATDVLLRFELQACPVVRKSSAGEGRSANGEKRTWNAGDELDAFLSEAWENPDADLEREAVYKRWLARQFDVRGGAAVDPASMAMERFAIKRMTRRPQGNDRPMKTMKRPDVTLTGTLRVTDADAFSQILRSGIGRHKSFGYGMLKVRRA